MFNRVMLFATISILILCLAGCGGGEEQKQASQPAAAPAPAPKPEENVPVYELTKDNITSHEGWTSRNISVFGVKLGDKTREVEKNLGSVENTRTLPKTETDPGYYLTIYENNGLFVYTVGLTGKIHKMEIYQTLAKKIADEKLKNLLAKGDTKTMHDVLGMEDGPAVDNAEDMSTEYPYDSRGFRFVKFKVKGQTVNALRFVEFKPKSS
jgi:hypothetical protein